MLPTDHTPVAQTSNFEFVHEVAALLHVELKPLGFTKRRHTWNRRVGDGVVQCIELSMDEYVPPHDHRPADALYRSWSANYALGAAVHFDEVTALWGLPTKDFIRCASCAVRWHHGPDVTSRWPIVGLPEEAAIEVRAALVDGALPWLDDSSQRAVLTERAPADVPTPALAAIAVRAGHPDAALTWLRADLADPNSSPQYVANIPNLAERLGLTL